MSQSTTLSEDNEWEDTENIEYLWNLNPATENRIAEFPQVQDDDFIDVCFHSVISPTFFTNFHTDRVAVVFDVRFGMTDNFEVKMDRPRPDGYVVGSVIVKVPVSCRLSYNYVVLHDDSTCTFEYFVSSGEWKEKGSVRRLPVHQQSSSKDICHYYDGIIRGKEELIGKYKNWWNNVKKMFGAEDEYKKFLKEDIELAVSAFLPKQLLDYFTDRDSNFEAVVMDLNQMNGSLKQLYHGICKFIGTPFDILFANVLSRHMKKLIDHLDGVNKEGLGDNDLLHLTKAAIAVYFVVSYDLKIAKTEKNMLCKALLPSPDYVTRTSPDVDQIKQTMPSILREIIVSIITFARKIAGKADNPSWLFCVPLIHFMLKYSKPFEDVPLEVNHNDAEQKNKWWGIVNIREATKKFKKCLEWNRPSSEIVQMLTPYFEVDYLLPRTVLASLSLQMFHEVLMNNMFPADITLAASHSHFCDLRDSQELDLLKNVLEHVASQIIGSDMDMSLSSLNTAFRTHKIATDLLNNVIQIKETKVLFLAIEIYLTSLHNFQKISDKVEKPENHNYKPDDLWRDYKHYRERIVHWLENDLFDNKEFKLWNAAFQLNLPEGGIQSSFTDFLKVRFRQTVEEKISPEKLVQIYCSHADTFEETVQEILSKAVLQAIESCSSFDWRKNKDGKSNLRLSELLSKVFEKEWGSKSLDNPIQDLEHALMWEPFHIYMELFCENPEAVNLNCQRIMAKFHGITKDLIEDLLQGSICVGSLRMLMSRKKQFRKIVPVIKISKPDTILKTLDGRHLELQAFENTYEIVQEFTHLCSKCKADTEPLKYQLKTVSTGDINTVSLDTLVDTSILHQQRDLENYRPIIIAFRLLSLQNIQVVPDIVNYCKGSLFMKIWKRKGKEMKKNLGRKLTINEVFNYVWHQTLLDWKILCKKFVSGDLTFTEFNKWFKTRDHDEIRKELMFLDNHKNTQWIDERLYQIKNFEILENCIYGAKVIIEVINEFDLKEENFSQIFDISRVTNVEDTPMKRLDRGLLNTCSILKEITKERADCLHELISCKSLVQWLQRTMKGGLKELQVFVDLASISAGEGDMEIAKVNCLHSATTGYAPLIFNLRQECDIEEFLQKCQDVWNDLDSNPQLPQKLRDTSRQIRWLKSVEEFHGAAEVTTLAQAEAINKRGVYQIGNLTRIPFEENPVLSDVIDLQVRHKEGRTSKKDKYYRYEQLHDLQSRLMLVAGKAEQGKDDVERFMLILDSIVRLGSIYVKLISDGCVLFSHWQIRIFCDPDNTVCAFVLFGSDEESQAVRTRIDEKINDVSLVIQELARFLEQCHIKWLDYIDQTRDKYFGLTYFTVDQMVILQKELVKVGSEAGPSPLVYSLISAVKRGCTKDDLTIAVSSSKANAIKTVTKGTKSRHIQGGKEDYPKKPHKEMAQKQTEDTLVSITESIFRRLDIKSREAEATNVVKILEQVWETFLTTFSVGVSDYLSIEHLGIILNNLAEQENVNIQRVFENCFSSGEPNLLICPQSEIYKTTIAVYSNDENSPLPQADEVLICTSNTTLDMVQIFWKRVFHSEGGKIFCLVNADLLDYDVSDKAENSLEKHMTTADSKDIQYRLVVICSSENEYKSRIVAALDKYHRPALYTDISFIRTYLFTKFQVESESKRTPACAVDFDRCSVRVVKSWRAGIGKTLFKDRMIEGLSQMVGGEVKSTSIPVHHKILNSDEIMEVLKKETLSKKKQSQRIFHIDISHEVQEGVDTFLFQLLVLGCHRHSSGYTWRRSDMDYYIIEAMPLLDMDNALHRKGGQLKYIHSCLDILPSVTCRSPRECLDIILNPQNKEDELTEHDILFDSQIFSSQTIQRPYRYLRKLMTSPKPANEASFTGVKGRARKIETETDRFGLHSSRYRRRLETYETIMKPENSTFSSVPVKTVINHVDDNTNCLETLLSHCGIKDPSWSEVYHFVSFLNRQLEDFEASAFCGTAAQEDLPGFSDFVLTCLLQMSRDFATRSLVVSEETPIQMMQLHQKNENDIDIIQQYQMRRTWETSPHPYLFFNPDHHSMTFLGFNIERRSGNLIDHQTRKVLEQQIMTPELFDALEKNDVNLAENFDNLQRSKKIAKLCKVLGLETAHDPDETYELTTDNVKKILAIYMRFRCGIPVIIMGETGCGKTRLVKFMCSLQQPPGVDVENMILMKVHGGTKSSDIIRKVRDAEDIASRNTDMYPNMFTVLFFDEANTTEAIGVIKEMMCDMSLNGKPMKLNQSLKVVAACNPYRKHSDELIQRLEQAGLGYHVASDKTTDTIGRVPMRRLVYRVQPLPQSMLPLVWDFGQLTADVEKMYIRQMVLRYIKNRELPSLRNLDGVLSDILTASQNYMRNQKDECSFVSLRDVERTLQVMSWFKKQSQTQNLLFSKMTQTSGNIDPESDSDDEVQEVKQQQEVDDVTRALILAIGVSYHACLKNRDGYRKAVAKYFKSPLKLKQGADEIEQEISKCQTVFLDSVKLAPNIARNQALKENVFMMIVCIEMRIPMFLVGKPGSSKSLAKTIVSDSMQGNAAQDDIFKTYKQVQMVSYQCSPLSVPEGIIGAFRQCASYQRDKDLDRYVSVVVLDEVGLAEDSPKMPLKTLHPLLEDGCIDDENQEKYKKVAFIGISNWSLDPAKMNRGILVQRDVPDITELIESAEGICSTNRNVLNCIKPLIQPLAESYLDLFQLASAEMREFFGLRDFYSLIKMLYAFASKSEQKPTWLQLQHCILRNFGGLDTIKPVDIFCRKVIVERYEQPKVDDPDNSPPGLIQACLIGDKISNSETRYLLLLTENYGALTVLQQKIFAMENVMVIFGSSFPSDQEYTQICRNINSIKICMETGSTVILLNLENLYESLYDALNQYYVEFGGERYVDLGLGTHRVKCRVHKKFRLIVVAEKQIVYDKFPIPLINRLEKHFLSLKTMLTSAQLQLTVKLQEWAQKFCEVKVPLHMRHLRPRQDAKKINESFIGYHADACAAIILHACQEKNCNDENIVELEAEVLDFSKEILLWCASPSSVLLKEDKIIFAKYFLDQHHENLFDYLHFKLDDLRKPNLIVQITTHSKLLSNADIDLLCKSMTSLRRGNVLLVTLQSFDTEQQFRSQIRSFFQHTNSSDLLLIVQCDSGDDNEKLIACARYTIKGELQKVYERTSNIHVVLLIQVPGIACGRFTGFQCGSWHSVHIDDVHPEYEDIPTVAEMYVQSVGDLLYPVINESQDKSEKTEEVEVQPDEVLSSKSSVSDPLYPVINESQDNSDKTEDKEIPINEGLSSNSLKDEKEIFITEEQETDQLKRPTNRDTLDLKRLNTFIADRDTQTEIEHKSGGHGSWNGLLWCCSRSVKQNRVQQRKFLDLSYHGYDTLDVHESAREHSVVMPVDYRRDTTDILLQEKNNHTVEPSLTDRTTKIIEKPKRKNQKSVQIENAKDKIENLKKHFKMDNLIKNCMQPALRFVKDTQSNPPKALYRLKILMKWLQKKEGDLSLLSGINKHLSILLKQREQLTGTLSTNWLAQEAIKPQNVNRPGTFRKFAVRCLEARIVPVLAGIIAFIDTNNNLRLLSDDETWKTDLWLRIINNPFLTQLKYSVIASSSLKQEMGEVPVKSTALDGKMFSACMPFSWLIFRQVDDILRKTIDISQAEDNDFDIVMKSSDIFQSLQLGELLTIYSEKYRQEVLHAFIKDLVYMVYPVKTDTECNLISEQVINGCRTLIQEEFGHLVPSMFGCHMIFIRHAVRFKHFSHIIRIRQEHGQEIMNMQQNYSSSHLITDEEITLDIFALHMLVEQLDTGEKTFDNQDNRMIWLREVCEYRPVVERVFGHFHQDLKRKEKSYGPRSQKGIEEIRFKWNRAFIVKMFFDHVCTNSKIQTNVTQLWTALSDGPKMSEVKSLEKIEKYLKDCNQDVIAQCSGKDNEKSQEFRERCNSFFMEVVSLVCFGTGTSPSGEVIDKLLTYITGPSQSESVKKVRSKQLTIFDASTDQAPVIRSFLLQKMIATCSDQDVQNHLSAYFTHAKDLLNTAKKPDHYIELCILVLQCFEDSLHQRHTGNDNIDIATQMLSDALTKISMDINILEKIKCIANVKFALVLVAKLIHGMNSTTSYVDEGKRRLLEAASCICEESNSQWPRKFLVKQLCRCHGIDIYHAIVNSGDASFDWICLPELREDYHQIKECSDRYIVVGEDYKELRDTVVETILTENSDFLEQILRKGNCGWQKRVQLLLALHREICLKNIKSQQVFSEKGTSYLRGYLKNHAIIKNKTFIDKLCGNSIWISSGNITGGMTLAEQSLFCLLTHYLILMLEIPGKSSLLTPLNKIALNPNSMSDSFFPTMPQDDLQDVKVMVLKALQSGLYENPVFYRCPNGHPYVIGNCGKAYTLGTCQECGAEIGGQSHQLNADNINDTGEDGTQKGHILGSATNLKPVDALYRKLSKASVAILRLLTHMSMFIGTNTNSQAVCQTIHPPIDQDDVYEYLLLHLNLDLTSVQAILGINRDDAVLFLHFLLVKIMDTLKDQTLSRDISGLLSKESRAKWEEQFAKRYIEPFLQDVKTKLSACNQMLLDDQRLGTDILMQILYETDKYPHRKDIQNLQEIPAMWRYRELITTKHLMQNLEGTETTMPVPVLRLFLQEDYHLRAIRFVPSIMRLQRMLIQKYNRKLDRTEIAALTIRDVKREMTEDGRCEDFEQLLKEFEMAWTCVKDLLKNWVCPVDGKLVVIDESFLRSDIADNAAKVSYLIPSYRDAGLCSYILLFYLIKHQNLFLQNICLKTDVPIDSLPTVHVKDISSAHLISYHPDKDLLPMVFANCNYSFEVGQGTRIEHNFPNLERQLTDRFLYSKSIVTGLEEIETITYRSESTNAVVFLELCEKIKQERLNPAVRSQICGELHMRNLPELCDSLDNLDIAISFLKSVGPNPIMSLSDFMENTLKIDKPLISTKAKTASKCKHTMSLWISFALERAKQLAKYDRKAFEGVSESFKVDLTMEQIHEIEEFLTRSPAEQISELLELIFECIVFKIDVPQNINDEDYIDISQISFRDQLIGYIDTSPFEEDLQIDDSLMVVIGQMPSDADDQLRILTAQSVDFWHVVNRCRQRKMR